MWHLKKIDKGKKIQNWNLSPELSNTKIIFSFFFIISLKKDFINI